MIKKITIYNINQYTKSGKLKKNAKYELSLTQFDCGKINHKANNDYLAKSIKQNGFNQFSTPYIFTHIDAKNAQGEAVMIFETVTVNTSELTTSPINLYKALTTNN